MISKKLIISKLMYRYKLLKIKNKKILIEIELLLFTINSTIENLSI